MSKANQLAYTKALEQCTKLAVDWVHSFKWGFDHDWRYTIIDSDLEILAEFRAELAELKTFPEAADHIRLIEDTIRQLGIGLN